MDEENPILFNRQLLAKRRARAVLNWPRHDFLKREAADRIADRLSDMARHFPRALDLGCHQGEFNELRARRGGIETLIQCDLSLDMARRAKGMRCVADEEFLPFADDSFDLIVSALALHHVNDLPGALIQIRRALKPDGLFVAIMPGANSLKELRAATTGASIEDGFGLSPRLSPLIEVRDAGGLLQRAGFALPVVDSDSITVEYDDALKLMRELQGMGEGNVLLNQFKGLTSPAQLGAIATYYHKHFPISDGGISATFELITLTGWKPHASQQKPLTRGSGQMPLHTVLKSSS